MKKSILSVAVLLCTATFAYAQEADAATDAAKEIAAAADYRSAARGILESAGCRHY